ncbi:MAG: multiheme c-type cytochrome [Planctomycetota bacterium]|nr:multiheme c-type cytochrome [Planctomycetota bacterium]
MRESMLTVRAVLFLRVLPFSLLGLTILLFGCGRNPAQTAPQVVIKQNTESEIHFGWPTDNRRSDVFTGSQACAECHADLARRYQTHPMARSMTTPDELPDRVMHTIPMEVQLGERTYGVRNEEVDQLQTEKMEDREGGIYTQECRIDLAFGSGTHGYTFATIHGNSLYQAPLTWYEDINGWDLSPGYDLHNHARFERRIVDECVNCHVGRVKPDGHNTNRFSENFILEASIGCERCHGPGAEHVKYHAAGIGADSRPDPIVNPSKLPADARDSVCFQCHLSGESRILRAGRSTYDFRPGDRISDIWVALVLQPVHDGAVAKSQAVSHAEQMVSSKCYNESNGTFQCISCHDPHGMPDDEQQMQFYNDRCRSCHEGTATRHCSQKKLQREQTAPPDSCVTCHMPRNGTSDIPHTARTDHRVLKSWDDATSERVEMALKVFQPDRQDLTEDEIQRAFGLTLETRARTPQELQEAHRLLSPLVSNDSNDSQVLRAAANLLLQLGDTATAERLIRKAVALRPTDEDILQTQLRVQWATGQYFGSLNTADTLLGLNPWSSSNLRTRASVLAQLGRFEDSVKAARESIEIDPTTLSTRQVLEYALKEAGKLEDANRQTELMQRVKNVNARR